jgi:hypothetical protein
MASRTSVTPSPVFAEIFRMSSSSTPRSSTSSSVRRHVGDGEVDLVEDRDDLQVVLHRQVQVGERLGLDALARVHDEECPLASRDCARDLVGEVHVPRGVDEVQRPLAVVATIQDPDGLGLDRDAPLPLDVHRVQDLGHPLPLRDRLGDIQSLSARVLLP